MAHKEWLVTFNSELYPKLIMVLSFKSNILPVLEALLLLVNKWVFVFHNFLILEIFNLNLYFNTLSLIILLVKNNLSY